MEKGQSKVFIVDSQLLSDNPNFLFHPSVATNAPKEAIDGRSEHCFLFIDVDYVGQNDSHIEQPRGPTTASQLMG